MISYHDQNSTTTIVTSPLRQRQLGRIKSHIKTKYLLQLPTSIISIVVVVVLAFAYLTLPAHPWSLLVAPKLLSSCTISWNAKFRLCRKIFPLRTSLRIIPVSTFITTSSTTITQLYIQQPQQQDNDDENNNDNDSFSFPDENDSINDQASYNNDNNDENDDYIPVDSNISTGRNAPPVDRTETTDTSTAIPTAQDLTDRFKYKVNALMGAFDPIDSSTDTESSSGNILSALLKFPVMYTFHVIGKTSGDTTTQSLFVEQVKDTISQSSSMPPLRMGNSDTNDDVTCDDVKYEITPRGTKYTKVTIQKEVINAEEITHIYDQLSKLELSVMQF